MGGLTKGKHVVQELDGVRCTIVESGTDEKRAEFLKGLLEANAYEVKIEKQQAEEEGTATYTVGVTDILFNPVIAIYSRKLYLPDGRIVTAAYWNQQSDQIDPRYWRFRPKS